MPTELVNNIKSVSYRKILNSHVEFTNEYIVEFGDGTVGVGSAPQGETKSIYEDSFAPMEPAEIVEKMRKNGYFGTPIEQSTFDAMLKKDMCIFGRSNCYALSVAFFNANNNQFQSKNNVGTKAVSSFPNLCMNILNGGKHAYTNPVLSDFHEYLLVSKGDNLREIINDHNRIQSEVKTRLRTKEMVLVQGNMVHKFNTTDNKECLEFLLSVLEFLHFGNKYFIMMDASATDLWDGQRYHLSLTDHSFKTSDEFYQYWLNMIKEYDIKFLEDPFYEKDYAYWQKLTNTQSKCNIIGDDLYSADPQRIQEGMINGYTNGIMVKPDQSGTVSSTIAGVEIASKNKQIVIMSHRSISTESVFLSTLTSILNVKYVKFGPMHTDYSSILRLNELIRLAGCQY